MRFTGPKELDFVFSIDGVNYRAVNGELDVPDNVADRVPDTLFGYGYTQDIQASSSGNKHVGIKDSGKGVAVASQS